MPQPPHLPGWHLAVLEVTPMVRGNPPSGETAGSREHGHPAPTPEIFELVFEFAPDAELLIDQRGHIVRANAQAESLFGYSRQELVGRPVEVLIPQRFAGRHVTYRDGYVTSPRLRPMGAGVDLFARRKDDTEVPVDILLNSLDTAQGPLVLAVVRDITARKRADEQLRASLREKETLLNEVHHRVKNNLAVIASTFYLQSTYVANEQAQLVLQHCQDRVRSMALVHERLYHSGDFASLDFGEYARELATGLFENYALRPVTVRLTLDLEPVVIELQRAVPAALVLNELIANALEHAFPGGRRGEVAVRLRARPRGGLCLEVVDDGVGMSPDAALDRPGSFGMRLLTSLARQLDGHIASSRATTAPRHV